VSYNVKQNSKQIKNKVKQICQKVVKICQKVVKVVQTFDPAEQKKSKKVVKKWSKYWQHRPKSSVSKTATMSALEVFVWLNNFFIRITVKLFLSYIKNQSKLQKNTKKQEKTQKFL
jgi:hypothetical protein